jgi:hypothetical protein
MYGWLTNTGVKIVIVVDMEGKPANAADSKVATAVGLRDADLKPVSLQLCIVETLLKSTGIQGAANSIHHAFAQPLLQSR